MAVDPGQAVNATTNAVLLKHAGSITAESVMKADPIGVSAGVYNYGPADQLVAFAQTNAIEVRGHALLWHQTSPAWFFEGDSTAPGYKDMVKARLETYITDVVTRFKGKVYAWDVVNEATRDDASGNYRNSQWYQIFGPDYIEIAFRAARAADPTVQLFINDYGTEDTAKLGRFMAIVDTMLARGVPIDGIGHQFHINTGFPTVANAEAALVAAETRGLVNHVTELDVSLYTTDSGSCYSSPPTGCQTAFVVGTAAYTNALRAQALQYRAMFNLYQAHASVKSVTLWGVADNSTWLSTFPTARLNHPLLFDTTGAPKSAFWAVVDPLFVP
ncbi:endo-1,4-beta-xylanase [Asticcacaulis sp. AC402]|nr:endo-1,4-beta-xylanase [Asticcacaulis sp. AC402]